MKLPPIVVLIISLILVTTVYAGEEVSTNFPQIKVTLLNQDPDPVEPGEVVEVRFKIENLGQRTEYDVIIEIFPDYPFSLYTGKSQQNVGKLRAVQTGSDSVIVDFKLKVDENAAEGDNEIEILVREGTTLRVFDENEFLIDVETPDIILDIPKVKVVPDVVPPGGEAEVIITLENRADSYLRAVKAELDVSEDTIPFSPIGSTTEKSIYQIPPRTIQELKFTLISLPDAAAKTYKIPLKIDFEDELGNKFNKSTLIGIKVGTIPDVELFIDEADFFKPKTKGRIIVQLVNKGLIDIKFATIELHGSDLYERLSPADIYLGEIESDDFETAEFELFMNTKQKDVPLVFDVTYLDANNNEFKQTYTEMLKVFDSSEAKAFGVEGTSKFGLFIVIVIVAFLAGAG